VAYLDQQPVKEALGRAAVARVPAEQAVSQRAELAVVAPSPAVDAVVDAKLAQPVGYGAAVQELQARDGRAGWLCE
jgi:hypothetical protein